MACSPVVTLVLTVLLTALVVRLPGCPAARSCRWAWCRRIAAGVVCVDLLTGARLQLNGVVGYSALQGGRFAGIGHRRSWACSSPGC